MKFTSTFRSLSISILLTISVSSIAKSENVVGYWGQNGSGSEKRLSAYCTEDGPWDTIVLSFLNIFFNDDSLPGLNFANHCGETFADHPSLLHCSEIAADIATCQQNGKKILLSLGGAAGSYGFSSETQATEFAKTIAGMFFNIGNSNYPKPFDSAIIDGIDLDIEGGSTKYYSTFVTELRSLVSNIFISAAPQCPIPDAFIDEVLKNSDLDALYIQFYNNFCGLNSETDFNFEEWSTYVKTNSQNKDVALYIGGAASQSAAGRGYVDVETFTMRYNSVKSLSNLGGFMLWSVSHSEANSNFAGRLKSMLQLDGPTSQVPEEPTTTTDVPEEETTTSAAVPEETTTPCSTDAPVETAAPTLACRKRTARRKRKGKKSKCKRM